MTHTPGPWFADDFEVYAENDPANLLAHIYAVDRPDSPDGEWEAGEETRANMRLIKAAPDMADLLRELSNWLVCEAIAPPEDMAQSFSPFRERIDALLLRSTGAA